MTLLYNIIVAVDNWFGIGKDGGIPWNVKEDLQYFKTTTSGQAVVMGRRTWESLPMSVRPLPNRLNIVVTSDSQYKSKVPQDVIVCNSHRDAIEMGNKSGRRVFVIGGAHLIESILTDPDCQCCQIHCTYICNSFHCDVELSLRFAGQIDKMRGHLDVLERQKCADGDFEYYRRVYIDDKIAPEIHFLSLLERVLDDGFSRQDRTGTGTIALFGQTMKYDLSDNRVPILTSKRVPWKSVIHELLWYLSGSTNVSDLHKVGIHYWDANSSRDFLDKRGLSDYPEGELGPVYGYQFRKWGGNIDQIANLIESLKTDPFSRRHIVSAWNVGDLDKMALPPCHCFSQFLVDDQQQLHCILYQRSADLPLGVPFNIACYSILVRMLCHLVPTLKPGSLTHMMGDCHIYKNHVDGVRQMLQHPPCEWPTLQIVGDVSDIDSFTIDNFVVKGYHPGPNIKFPMAV